MLAAPDIDVDVFHSQARDIGTLPYPFAIVISRRDRALGFSRFIAGCHPRVGNGRDIAPLQRAGIAVADASEVGGGGHGVFASSPTMIKLIENNRATVATLVDKQSTTSPSVVAEGVAACKASSLRRPYSCRRGRLLLGSDHTAARQPTHIVSYRVTDVCIRSCRFDKHFLRCSPKPIDPDHVDARIRALQR